MWQAVPSGAHLSLAEHGCASARCGFQQRYLAPLLSAALHSVLSETPKEFLHHQPHKGSVLKKKNPPRLTKVCRKIFQAIQFRYCLQDCEKPVGKNLGCFLTFQQDELFPSDPWADAE